MEVSVIDKPLELLIRLRELGIEVLVKLKDNSEYRGVVENVDASMNLILDGAAQVEENGNPIVKYGKVFIRGSNIMYVAVVGNRVTL
ncbi:MAG: LSM domain-containing protein [Thermofilaceae archaeon]